MRSRRLSRGDGGPADVDLDQVVPEGCEEAEPFVEVEMQRQERTRFVPRSLQRLAQGLIPVPAEHEHRPVLERDLDARGVAAAIDRLRPGSGNRATAAPDRQTHVNSQVARARRSP